MTDTPAHTAREVAEVMARALMEVSGLPADWPERQRAKSQAILSALSAAGCVVVPREPTNAMIDAGCEVRDATSSREANTHATWHAMLAAAKEPAMSDLIERATWLENGQDDPQSHTIRDLIGALENAQAALRSAEARERRLREALEPLALIPLGGAEKQPDSVHVCNHPAMPTLGDVRRARAIIVEHEAALAAKGESDEC